VNERIDASNQEIEQIQEDLDNEDDESSTITKLFNNTPEKVKKELMNQLGQEEQIRKERQVMLMSQVVNNVENQEVYSIRAEYKFC